jgi:hypothetical protein
MKPIPTTSKLAKFVMKLMGYFPLVSVKTKILLESKVYDLNMKLQGESDRNRSLQKDYLKLIGNISIGSARMKVDINKNNIDTMAKYVRFTANIEPVSYHFMIPENETRINIADETHYMIRKVAHEISKNIADQYEENIYQLATEKFNVLAESPSRSSQTQFINELYTRKYEC